ncbi:MAG: PD-(D/E)XK nuclease family transposase [Bacteroidota bacterium]
MIRERYINLFTDFGFKRVFGQEANKDLLVDFLNQVLPVEYEIQDLTFSKNDHPGAVNDMLAKVFKIAEVSKMNSTEKEAYIRSLKYLRDLHNVVDTAFAEGEQAGLKKKNTQVIQKGIASGLSVEILAELTGLSIEHVQKIVEHIKIEK